jgi:hypothetical protein
LKRINEILSQRKFEKLSALKSHRQVLEKNVTRTRTLIETIDKTICRWQRPDRVSGSGCL